MDTGSSTCNADVPAVSTYGLATTSGGSLASTISIPTAMTPVLQAQDSTFVGTNSNGMVAFDQSANVKWTLPNDSPQIATADGGVIGYSGVTYDNQGRATRQIALPTESWTGNGYEISVSRSCKFPLLHPLRQVLHLPAMQGLIYPAAVPRLSAAMIATSSLQSIYSMALASSQVALSLRPV